MAATCRCCARVSRGSTWTWWRRWGAVAGWIFLAQVPTGYVVATLIAGSSAASAFGLGRDAAFILAGALMAVTFAVNALGLRVSATAQTVAYFRPIDIAPIHALSWWNLGIIHTMKGEWSMARDEFQKCVDLDSNQTSLVAPMLRQCAEHLK